MKMQFARLLSVISFVTPVFSATHTVKEGDNMYRIALNHGVTLQALQSANPSARVGGLKIGQTLQIPSGGKKVVAPTVSSASPKPSSASLKATTAQRATGNYVIAEGDTFSSIAKARGISVADLQQLNPDVKPTTMRIGQEIKVAGNRNLVSPAQVASKNSTMPTASEYATPVVAQKSPQNHSAAPSLPVVPKQPVTSASTSSKAKVPETEVVASTPPNPVEPPQVPSIAESSPPVEISAAATSVPLPAEAKMPRATAKEQPKQVNCQLIRTSREMTLADFAAEHSVSVAALNEINGWNFPASTLLAVDSELLLPAQP
jgi:LysM repeat protein